MGEATWGGNYDVGVMSARVNKDEAKVNKRGSSTGPSRSTASDAARVDGASAMQKHEWQLASYRSQ